MLINPEDNEFDLGGGFVSGTYWPLALQNSWKLIDADGNEQHFLINNNISVGGKTFYQFAQFGIDDIFNYPLSVSAENGVYTS